MFADLSLNDLQARALWAWIPLVMRKFDTPDPELAQRLTRSLNFGSRVIVTHDGSLTIGQVQKMERLGGVMQRPRFKDRAALYLLPATHRAMDLALHGLPSQSLMIGDQHQHTKRERALKVIEYVAGLMNKPSGKVEEGLTLEAYQDAVEGVGDAYDSTNLPLWLQDLEHLVVRGKFVLQPTEELEAEREANEAWGAW